MFLRSAIFGVCFIALCSAAPVSAADISHTLIIGDDDGYGTSACLADGAGSSCGKIVADALCQSRGFSKASAFHKAEPEEVTGSIADHPVTNSAFLINCDD